MSDVQIEVGAADGRRYRVEIAHGLRSRLDEALNAHGVRGQRIVASTTSVWRLAAPHVPAALREVEPILLPDGERYKVLATATRVYDALVKAGADRGATLVAIGGGVLGDTAGFAAATYMRGIALVHVPTTLLAQVDSAIGGKVAVNHAQGKNLIGAFHPPAAVLIDPAWLDTLPRREFRAGLYEVVKYGVIADPELFATLETQLPALFARSPELLVSVIASCCRIKGRIVAADEHEKGERRVLNFGHTVGHAIEAVTRYKRFRHGEAIAYGMLVATRIAVARGVADPDLETRLAGADRPARPAAFGRRPFKRRDSRGDRARQENRQRAAALRPPHRRRSGDRRRRRHAAGTGRYAARVWAQSLSTLFGRIRA